MHVSAPRFATLVAYAALVCGGAFACLVLLSGPAAAASDDAPGDDASGLSLDRVGETLGGATRDLGRGAGELVRDLPAPVRPAAPVAEPAAAAVTTTSDRVAEGVEQVTTLVDDAVAPALPPAPAPAPEDDPGPGTDGPGPDAGAAPLGPDERTSRADPRETRTAPAKSSALRGTSTAVTVGDAGPVGRTAPSFVEPRATATHPHAPEPLAPVAGCDECAASGTSGEPLHVLGLPCQDATTLRFVGAGPRDAAQGGPATVFRRPDVSPD